MGGLLRARAAQNQTASLESTPSVVQNDEPADLSPRHAEDSFTRNEIVFALQKVMKTDVQASAKRPPETDICP